MDWSNERYVRLYVRDTTTWKRLGWDGQCVLMALLRKLDRAGTLDLDGLEPWEAVMLHVGCPEQVAREAIAKLVDVTGTLAVIGTRLTMPHFLDAQECTKSDKQRQRESRENRARGNIPSRTVASAQSPNLSQYVTNPSQAVTAGHDASQSVTFGHSVLCSAVPCSAVQEGAGTAAVAAPPSTPSAPSRQASGAHIQEWSEILRTVFERSRRAAPKATRDQTTQLAERCRDLARVHGVTFAEAAQKLAEAALASTEKYPFSVMSLDPFATAKVVPTYVPAKLPPPNERV